MTVNPESNQFMDNYLSRCQIDTPDKIVEFVWKLVKEYRRDIRSVLDLGAGSGNFSRSDVYDSYLGIEVDSKRLGDFQNENRKRILNQCAFFGEDFGGDFDLAIGNPPYVRHHDLSPKWKLELSGILGRALDEKFDKRANGFVYFMCQALLSTADDGLCAQVVPYEWVSRPSAAFLRNAIEKKGWSVDVYRFESNIFTDSKVLTTASLSIIDKSTSSCRLRFFKVSEDLKIKEAESVTGSDERLLSYTKRDKEIFAQRGLSPGSQTVFCLTEKIRKQFGLKVGFDVFPCITQMKTLPPNIDSLDENNFFKYYVLGDQKCWLVSPSSSPSKNLQRYFDSVPEELIDTYTCRKQSPWWRYSPHPSPSILYNSGFTKFGPRTLTNRIGAIAIGTVHGVHQVAEDDIDSLINHLKAVDFERQIVSHSNKLKKVEVNQMNSVIVDWLKRQT